MTKTNMTFSLAKVLIAAAWADGKIDHEEINCLKDLLFRMPEMTANDWAKLEIYIESPISESDRAVLVEDLKNALTSQADKSLAMSKLEEVLNADGLVAESEHEIVNKIKTSLEEVNVNIFGRFTRLIQDSIQKRSDVVASTPSREQFLDDFIKNKIFYKVRRRLADEQTVLDLAEAELRKLSLAGGLLAQVAYVDREVSDAEFDAIVDALVTGLGLSREAAVMVAEVSVNEVSKDLDYYRISREFFEATTAEEREDFIELLYVVASGDGMVAHKEMEEIRMIANALKLTHKQFIEAKLKIPREKRAY